MDNNTKCECGHIFDDHHPCGVCEHPQCKCIKFKEITNASSK